MPVDDEMPVGRVGEHAGPVGEHPAVGRGEEGPHALPERLLVVAAHGPVDGVGVGHLVEVVVQANLESCSGQRRWTGSIS